MEEKKINGVIKEGEKMKVKKSSLSCFFIITLLFHIFFIRFPFINNYLNIQRILMIIVLVFILLNYSLNIKKYKIDVVMIIYGILVLISGYINRDKHEITHTLVSSFTYVISLFEFYYATKIIANKKDYTFIIKSLFYISLIYVLINDLLLLFRINPFGQYYLLGNKFDVSYLHLFVIASYLTLKKQADIKKKIIFSIMIIISFIVFKYVKCSTGIIGLFIFILLLIFFKNKNKINSKLFFSSLLISSLFVFFVERILQISFIQNFIVNFLNRDLTLTGRIIIYENIPQLLKNHIMFGYGYSSSYETWMKFIYYPNSQNGLIDFIVEQGIIATCFFLIMLKRILFKIRNINFIQPIFLFIIVLNILASVEITINIFYVGLMLLLYSSYKEEEKSNEKS